MATPPPDWSPDERIALVKELERREVTSMRRATRAAQAALAVVALVFVALLAGVFIASRQLGVLRSDVATLAREKEKQTLQLDAVNREIKEKQTALAALIGAVRTGPGALSGVGAALDQNPRAATLVPRAYVQITDDMDRQWARNLSDRFQNGGVIPVGIEYVPAAKGLGQFEVRYYKKAEEAGATRIVEIMKAAGVDARLVYLNLENNKRVRDNHYEVWCPPNARAHKLRPLGAG